MSSSRIERKLAAIMFTDIVGFTKIMTTSEDTAINILKAQDDIISPLLEEYSGNLLKKMGDGMLVEFSSAVDAVECAMKIQSSIKEYNSTDNDEFHIRIGIHLGDVVMLGDDILGDGVNIASRIEPLASPDGICITEAVHQSIKSKLKIDARRISEVELKHIDDKYTIYKLPNVEDENDVVDDELSFLTDKIQINRIEKLTGLKYALLTAFSLPIVKYFVIPLGFLICIEQGIDYYNNNSDVIFPGRFILTPLLYFLLLPLTLGHRKYKISFDDIRKVVPTLDNIVINGWFHGKYERVKNEQNSFTYIGYGSLFHKKIAEKFNIKSWELGLNIKIDGNTMQIEGLVFKISSLIKNIKKISIIKKS